MKDFLRNMLSTKLSLGYILACASVYGAGHVALNLIGHLLGG